TGNVTTEVKDASGNLTTTVKDKNGQVISTTTMTHDGKGGYASVTTDKHGKVISKPTRTVSTQGPVPASFGKKPPFVITVLFPCLFGTMALFFLVIGLRGVVTKKPFLISTGWLLVVVLLGISPAMLQFVTLPTSGDGSGSLMALRWLGPTMLVVVVIFLSFAMRGYLAFGVTDTSFRDGLLASLEKLNLPHEETLAAM